MTSPDSISSIRLDIEHPQPFLQRPWASLDGDWEFAIDTDQRHTSPSDVEFDQTITVPFAPETPASGIHAAGYVQCCWYRRTVSLDALDADPLDADSVVVHFGGVDRIADVWANGQHVAHHVGGYSSFTVDVTEAIRSSGPQERVELIVRAVDDGHDLDAPRGKQDWQPIPHAVWYPRTTGIWKTVWVERVSTTRVTDVRWDTDATAMEATLTATLTGLPADADTRLRVRLAHADRVLVDDDLLLTGSTVRRTWPIGDGGFDDRIALAWWPARPTLLDGELTVSVDGDAVDRAQTYTALRSVDVADGAVRINGRPYPLRMVLDQGYWSETGATPPDVDALRRDIELTKALGFNGARKHQKTEDLRYLSLADRMGLLVWVEMPSAYRSSDASATALVSEWSEIVSSARNHPSVIAWVPVNESWGVQECETDPRQRALIETLRHLTDALDGTRPVSANDGWETAGGSIVGVHDYEQNPESLAARYDDVAAITDRRRGDGHLADLDRAEIGERAAVLSEFGGTALATDTNGNSSILGTESWGYDNAASPEELLARYRALWSVVHDNTGLAGACWTQLTDVYQEVNGLLRMDRSPKIDTAAIAAATRGRPHAGDG